MNKIKAQIPNTITCLNLLAGCFACVLAFYGEYNVAAYLIILAAIFDFIDGFAARLLKAYSPMGKELDSLADMVSFGLAPAVMLFSFMSRLNIYVAFCAFLLTVFSALRLAKFNIDERQTSSFLGLPTPANALFWVFLIKDARIETVLNEEGLRIVGEKVTIGTLSGTWFLPLILACIAVFCYLMLSAIPMFSLKFKNFGWKGNEIRYIFLIISVLCFAVLQFAAFPLIIGIYILISVFSTVFSKNKPKNTDEINEN